MRSIIRALAVLVAILVIAGTVVAQSVGTVERSGEAQPRFERNRIAFNSADGKNGLTLRVSGPDGYQFEKVYGPGINPEISVMDLVDGFYRYELRIVLAVGSDDAEGAGAKRPVVPANERGLRKRAMQPRDAIVESGYFTVKSGSFVARDEGEAAAVVERSLSEPDPGATGGSAGVTLPNKDFVILDDLIVDGSACIGFDCVNGESFGFDTIRLKENNLRIKFDDTSTASSYPRNDWQITANDSANGGASKFSVDDISGNRTPFTIEANARSHSLYIDDGGRIGSRTSTPSVEIHTIDGDTPTLRLQQDGSSGFAPQTWDVAGNETNFFIRDVTNGSQLPFRIRPDAPTNSIFADVDGDVGFGTSSPEAALHTVRSGGTASAKTMLHLENNGGVRFDFEDTSAGGFWRFQTASSANELQITRSGTGATELVLDNNGNLEITGDLTVVGGCTGCDAVFQPGYELESIEEHAASMWKNSYLPGVGPTAEGKTKISVFQKTTGILNELEKAHIYIEQLHAKISELEKTQVEAMQMKAIIDNLQSRVEKLENGSID